jgi:crotonobetainyl-CoA:carnitine CoA-transferase CaiB-like acyl-CoA transferase
VTSPARERPLEGLRVVDLSRALAGPYATLLLAGLGAEVIKIEDPGSGDLARENSPYVGRDGVTLVRGHDDDVSISQLTRARGKYGVSLNLKQPEARDIFLDLVRTADIVVENFIAGTADRLGVGYEAAKAANPRIIYCSLSGFGADDTGSGRAMDIIIQALSGVMYASGGEGEPPVRVGLPIADMIAPFFALIGILSALEQRHRTGAGQQVDVSMLGALTSVVAIENWEAMAAAGLQARTGLTMPRLAPFGVFACADGHIALVALQEKALHGLLRAMGRPDLIADPRFANRDKRVANGAALEALVNGWLGTLPVAEVVRALETEGVPVAPVRHPHEAMIDPRVTRRAEIVQVSHPAYPSEVPLHTAGIPIAFSDADTGFDALMAVSVGEHNERILGGQLGYSPERLAELRAKGVI